MSNNLFKNIDLLGGRAVDPKSGIDKVLDLFIRKGKIYHQPPDSSQADKVYHLKGHTVLPGLLDLRSHNRVPGAGKSENIETLTKAAARGGFSSILTMPDTNPYSDNPATIRYIQDRIKQTAKVNVYLSGCLTIGSRGESIAPLGSLKDVGVVAVTDCPYTAANNQIFTNAIKYAKMFGLTVIDFPQDSFLSNNSHAHESPLSLKMGLAGNPRMAEEIAVERSIIIARHLGVPIHLSSISSSGSVNLIKKAKDIGIPITADVSAHHLLLTEEAISDYNTSAKTNPPLRQESDRSALREGIINGIIDACSSSHEPYSDHLKDVEFDLAPSGTTGLETALLAFMEAVNLEDPYPMVVEKLCDNPHTILGISPPSLKDGSSANLAVVKNNESWQYDPLNGESLSHNSPLKDHIFTHKVILTLCDGVVAYSN